MAKLQLNLKRSLEVVLKRCVQWITHPVFIFVAMQVVWLSVTILWVFWFFDQSHAISDLQRTSGGIVDSTSSGLITLTLGCVLLGIILLGMVMLFAFIQKQKSLIRQQRSFVSSITHELKSPLASLQLSLETLQRKDLPDKVLQKLANMAESDIERLVRLVNRILLSGQMDRGVFDFGANPEKFNMIELIETLREQARYMDAEIDRRVKIKCPSQLRVQTFKMAVSLILGNLLENAIKYSPQGSPIEIEVSQEAKHLVIIVRDQGFGLLKKDLKKIFRMFYRSGLATKKALPGAGLGLYIIKSTAKMLGGQVWASSKGPNKGSTFAVMIPHRPML